jgi:hypothetical protein
MQSCFSLARARRVKGGLYIGKIYGTFASGKCQSCLIPVLTLTPCAAQQWSLSTDIY